MNIRLTKAHYNLFLQDPYQDNDLVSGKPVQCYCSVLATVQQWFAALVAYYA